MPRRLDRIFKLSRVFKASPGFHRFLRYSEYGDGVPGWDGYYTFLGRCIAFRANTFRDNGNHIVWLHECR